MNPHTRLLLPACVAPSNPYFPQTVSMGPIRAGEMRKGDPYEGENFDVTDWGCLEEGATLDPLMPVRVEGVLERLIV